MEKLPVYECPRINHEIKLTGKLDDPAWEKAPAVHLLQAHTGEAARFATEVRITYSDTRLYVGFHCEDDYVWGTHTERDAKIFNEECVEVFLCPANTFHQYYEINVSPKNVVYDACILNTRVRPGHRTPFQVLTDYSPQELRTAVHVEGKFDKPGQAKFWNVEYSILFEDMIGALHNPPQKGDQWRMNLCRIDHPKSGEREFYSWSPTGYIDFHIPWRFGFLKFV